MSCSFYFSLILFFFNFQELLVLTSVLVLETLYKVYFASVESGVSETAIPLSAVGHTTTTGIRR